MAPFLVIFLLLALGAGIVAWHTIGHPHVPAAPRRPASRPARKPIVARAAAPVADTVAPTPEPVFAPTLDAPMAPPARSDDPFAHAPSFEQEARR